MVQTIIRYVSFLLFLCLIVSSGSLAMDWPMEGQNPAHTGHSSDDSPITNETFLITQLSDETGYISGCIVNGKLYTGVSSSFQCVDAYTGTVLWTTNNLHTYESPAVVEDKVYINEYQTGLTCVDAATGQRQWTFPLTSIYSAPTVVNDLIYVSTGQDKHLYCVDTEGNELWNFTASQSIYTTPAVSDDKVYISASRINGGTSQICCVDASTGSDIWKYDHEQEAPVSLTVYDDRVYVASDYSILCLDAQGNGDGLTTLLWDETLEAGSKPTMIAAADGRLYFSHVNRVYCLNAATGAEHFRFDLDGDMVPPAVTDQYVYVGGGQNMYCLDGTLGSLIWQYDIGRAIRCQPIIADDRVWVFGGHYSLYGFGASTASDQLSTPAKPQGDTSAQVNQQYTYATTSISLVDPSVQVTYLFDWGDGTDSGWLQTASARKTWTAPGTYTIKVKAQTSEGETSTWSQGLPVTVTLPMLTITAPSTITEESSSTITITSGGVAVEDATVTVFNTELQTNSLGQVTCTSPTVSSKSVFTIVADKEGYQSTQLPILVNPVDDIVEVGFFFGAVTDQRGTALNDATVCCLSTNYDVCVQTDAEGSYVVELPAGTYDVTISQQGFTPKTKTQSIATNQAKEINMYLVEKIAKDDTKDSTALFINEKTKDGKIGGQVTVDATGVVTTETYLDGLTIETMTAEQVVTCMISGEEGVQGTIIVLSLGLYDIGTPLQITYDQKEIQEAADTEAFFNEPPEEAQYLILIDVTGQQYAFVSIPHFSTHTISISSVMETLTGPTLMMLYVGFSLLALGIFLTRVLSHPIYLYYLKRKH